MFISQLSRKKLAGLCIALLVGSLQPLLAQPDRQILQQFQQAVAASKAATGKAVFNATLANETLQDKAAIQTILSRGGSQTPTIDPLLTNLAPVNKAGSGSARVAATTTTTNPTTIQANGRVLIGVYARTTAQANGLLAALKKEGFALEARENTFLEGWFPLTSLSRLAGMPGLAAASAIPPLQTKGGLVTAQADVALKSDLVRKNRLVTGKGVKIGIISNSFNVKGGQTASVLAGDLPGPGNPDGYTKPVQILRDATPETVFSVPDEGRAMAEIIYDIAPGAELAFYGPLSGASVEIKKAYRALAEAGCQIIVDDLGAVENAWFQDEGSAITIDSLVNKGITVFTAAGNFGAGEEGNAFRFYESNFNRFPISLFGEEGFLHNFAAPGNDAYPFIPVRFDGSQNPNVNVTLQWDQPWGSICADCEASKSSLYWVYFNQNFQVVAVSGVDRPGDALNTSIVNVNAGATAVFFAAIFQFDNDGPLANQIKIVYRPSGSSFADPFFNTLFRNTPTVLSHSNARRGISVGASAWFNTPAGAPLWNKTIGSTFNIQLPVPQAPLLSYTGSRSVFRNPTASALGGQAILFDTKGNRLAQPEIRQNPTVVATDGGQTSFFALNITGIERPFFLGTSAAAPAAAAAGALLQSAAKGKLSPDQIRDYLTKTAQDMDNPYKNGFPYKAVEDPNDATFTKGFDLGSGFGLIQADKAIDQYVYDAGIQGIKIEPVCQSVTERKWVLKNPNGFGVTVTMTVNGATLRLDGQTTTTSSSLTFIVPPGEFNFFTNVRQFSSTTIRLRWNNPPGISGSNQASYSQLGNFATTCPTSPNARIASLSEFNDAETTRVYPNPSPTGHFTVEFLAPEAVQGKVEVLDLKGQLIYGENRNLEAGTNIFDLDVPGATKGVYLLRINAGRKVETRKIMN